VPVPFVVVIGASLCGPKAVATTFIGTVLTGTTTKNKLSSGPTSSRAHPDVRRGKVSRDFLAGTWYNPVDIQGRPISANPPTLQDKRF
jgi:hypothetical protein